MEIDAEKVERVGPNLYSKLRHVERPNDAPRQLLGCFRAVTLGCIAVLLIGLWAMSDLRAIAHGGRTHGTVAMVVLGVFVLFGPVFPIVVANVRQRRKGRELLATPVPEHVPQGAVYGSVTYGWFRSEGWYWVEEGFLCFRGQAFDFRLKRSDFVERDVSFSSDLSWHIRVPEPVLRTIKIQLDYHYAAALGSRRHSRMAEGMIQAWEAANEPARDSVFPPLRDPNPQFPVRCVWWWGAPFGAVPGAAIWALLAMVPRELVLDEDRLQGVISLGPWLFAICLSSGVLASVMLQIANWSGRREKRQHYAEVEAYVAEQGGPKSGF